MAGARFSFSFEQEGNKRSITVAQIATVMLNFIINNLFVCESSAIDYLHLNVVVTPATEIDCPSL